MIIPRRSNGRRETVETNSPLSRVAVHSAEDEVHAKVGDQYAQECDDAVGVEEHRAAHCLYRAAVQRGAVYEHRYQCPYLLGVPAPVAPPRYICPHSTDEYSGCEQEHGRVEHQAAYPLQLHNLRIGISFSVTLN